MAKTITEKAKQLQSVYGDIATQIKNIQTKMAALKKTPASEGLWAELNHFLNHPTAITLELLEFRLQQVHGDLSRIKENDPAAAEKIKNTGRIFKNIRNEIGKLPDVKLLDLILLANKAEEKNLTELDESLVAAIQLFSKKSSEFYTAYREYQRDKDFLNAHKEHMVGSEGKLLDHIINGLEMDFGIAERLLAELEKSKENQLEKLSQLYSIYKNSKPKLDVVEATLYEIGEALSASMNKEQAEFYQKYKNQLVAIKNILDDPAYKDQFNLVNIEKSNSYLIAQVDTKLGIQAKRVRDKLDSMSDKMLTEKEKFDIYAVKEIDKLWIKAWKNKKVRNLLASVKERQKSENRSQYTLLKETFETEKDFHAYMGIFIDHFYDKNGLLRDPLPANRKLTSEEQFMLENYLEPYLDLVNNPLGERAANDEEALQQIKVLNSNQQYKQAMADCSANYPEFILFMDEIGGFKNIPPQIVAAVKPRPNAMQTDHSKAKNMASTSTNINSMAFMPTQRLAKLEQMIDGLSKTTTEPLPNIGRELQLRLDADMQKRGSMSLRPVSKPVTHYRIMRDKLCENIERVNKNNPTINQTTQMIWTLEKYALSQYRKGKDKKIASKVRSVLNNLSEVKTQSEMKAYLNSVIREEEAHMVRQGFSFTSFFSTNQQYFIKSLKELSKSVAVSAPDAAPLLTQNTQDQKPLKGKAPASSSKPTLDTLLLVLDDILKLLNKIRDQLLTIPTSQKPIRKTPEELVPLHPRPMIKIK